MRILCTGPESSGTSLVSRILEQAGASTGVEVFHRSALYVGDYNSLRNLAKECDVVIVVFRDPFATMKSQEWTGKAYEKLQDGYYALFWDLKGIKTPKLVITYEQLVLNPASINPLLEQLGLDPSLVTETVRNENAKYK